jgi:hypothetical protein
MYMTEPPMPRVRPANKGDVDAVFELAATMAVSFTVDPEAFRRSSPPSRPPPMRTCW